MAVKLRLKRMGAKKTPFYRIVAAESRSPRDGRFIEIVGTYNPIAKTDSVTLKEELVLKWLNNGAQPTDTVRNILSQAGIMQKFHESKIKKTDKADKPAKKAKTQAVAKSPEAAKTEKDVKVTKEAKSTKKATEKESKTAGAAEATKAKTKATKKTEKTTGKPAAQKEKADKAQKA